MFPVSSEAFTKGNMMQTEQKFVYLWVVYNQVSSLTVAPLKYGDCDWIMIYIQVEAWGAGLAGLGSRFSGTCLYKQMSDVQIS